jgi:hypothetical protein
MKPGLWLPVVAFLATSIPVILLLYALDIGSDYRIWIAMAVGVLAMAMTQKWMAGRAARDGEEQ